MNGELLGVTILIGVILFVIVFVYVIYLIDKRREAKRDEAYYKANPPVNYHSADKLDAIRCDHHVLDHIANLIIEIRELRAEIFKLKDDK